ncbi:MAG: DUF87 domain-containing protein [Deltaproteobacteria bacterium]|nr:DUF87 domain-containing protein [Deltaproteobacteria bacterium]
MVQYVNIFGSFLLLLALQVSFFSLSTGIRFISLFSLLKNPSQKLALLFKKFLLIVKPSGKTQIITPALPTIKKTRFLSSLLTLPKIQLHFSFFKRNKKQSLPASLTVKPGREILAKLPSGPKKKLFNIAKSTIAEGEKVTVNFPELPQLPPKPVEPVKVKIKSDFKYFKLPDISLLSENPARELVVNKALLLKNSQLLEDKLKDFGVEGRVTQVRPGPVITLYEFAPASGVKVSKIASLSDDLALSLSALSVRIIAPIPGKNVVGIEIPNETRHMVYLRDLLENQAFRSPKYHIPMPLGKTALGDPYVADLLRMPHLLIAGATGSGKSVFVNSLICSLLYRFKPSHVRMIMIDPKMLELSYYDDIPNLLLPVVTDPRKAAMTLKWAVREMERRYDVMAKIGARNVDSFNQRIEISTMREKLGDKGENIEKMPYIIIIIDELADLMMVTPKDVEISITRLAQMARAAGIHLIVATQRPSVDVITGLIKANFPARISFQVSSKIDSRTILDTVGAERLLGEGDMLYLAPGTAKLKRLHAAFISDNEIKNIVDFLKDQSGPDYNESILQWQEEEKDPDIGEDDELYHEAISLVRGSRVASISMIQRRLRIGYNRAARMIERMEIEGLVGPADGAKPREILVE